MRFHRSFRPPLATNPYADDNSLSHAVVKLFGGPEADDGVDNGRGEHRGAAVYDGDENGVLLTVIAVET